MCYGQWDTVSRIKKEKWVRNWETSRLLQRRWGMEASWLVVLKRVGCAEIVNGMTVEDILGDCTI